MWVNVPVSFVRCRDQAKTAILRAPTEEIRGELEQQFVEDLKKIANVLS